MNFFKKNSLPLRVYLRRDNIEALSGLSARFGVSISSLVNAAVKVGLEENKMTVVNDAKDAKKHVSTHR